MASFNFLGNLKREFHHIKVVDASVDRPQYEGAMVILREDRPGRSFIIPQSAGWKYIDPKDNLDAAAWDKQEFDRIAGKVFFKKQLGMAPSKWADDAAAIVLAEQMNINSGFMLTLGFNLVKCCQILDLTADARTLAQLLMFIQDGLTDLRKIPLHVAEGKKEIGEYSVTINDKTTHHALTVSESEMAGVI